MWCGREIRSGIQYHYFLPEDIKNCQVYYQAIRLMLQAFYYGYQYGMLTSVNLCL